MGNCQGFWSKSTQDIDEEPQQEAKTAQNNQVSEVSNPKRTLQVTSPQVKEIVTQKEKKQNDNVMKIPENFKEFVFTLQPILVEDDKHETRNQVQMEKGAIYDGQFFQNKRDG